MKRMLGTLAILSLLAAAGCSTTAPPVASNPGVAASATGSAAPLECLPGWNACVCSREGRCCKLRMDCNCAANGEAYCTN